MTYESEEIELQPVILKPLLTYLYEQYKAAREKTEKDPDSPEKPVLVKMTKSVEAGLKEFLDYAQAFLDSKPPLRIDYLDTGIGFTLGNGQPVTIAKGAESELMRDEGIHITRPLRSNWGPTILQDNSIPVGTPR